MFEQQGIYKNMTINNTVNIFQSL